MSIPGFVAGWVSDPKRVQAVIQARQAAGQLVMGADYIAKSQPQLAGSWQRAVAGGTKGIFLRDHEIKVYGHYLRPYLQRRGTCVSRGTARGAQTSLTVALSRGQVLKPVKIAFAPIYSMARHEFGKDRCGSGDGAILADAMHAVHDGGVATDELFQGMTEDQIEMQAVHFAAPGVGTPQTWLTAAKDHTAVTFYPETLELIFDCIAAGYAVPYACGYITGQPDANGMSRLGSAGGHCRCFVGVYIDVNGKIRLESSESWGAFPAGQPQDSDQTGPVSAMPRITIRTAGGDHVLAPGDVGVDADQFWSAIQSGGEAWAIGIPAYPASSVAESLNAKSVT